MKKLMEKVFSTIRYEGIIGLIKKTIRYIKFKFIYRKKYKKAYKDILFINGCTLPHPQRYRVSHQMEQLEAHGMTCDEVFYLNIDMDSVKYYRGFIFYRTPITSEIEEFIKMAKDNNKLVMFDIDDLVIDKKYTDQIEFLKTLSEHDRELYDDGVVRMGKTLSMCDYAITTTKVLKEELEHYTKNVFINKNVASEEMCLLSEKAIKEKVEHDDFIIGYLSGSITHNPDIELVKPVLLELLEKYKTVKLKFVGELSLDDEFNKYKDQIICEKFTDWRNLPNIIASLDINIAPLEDTLFNRAKSENKWTEASLVKTVTIASDVGAFHDTIKNGIDGFLCKDLNSWRETLEKLINDKNLCNKVANNAYKRVKEEYITTYTGHPLKEYISTHMSKNIAFVLPNTNISGGVNVIIRHMTMLKKHGYDVFVINHDKSEENIVSKWGTINVIKHDKLKLFGYIDTMVASLWTTLPYVKEQPNVRNKLYLVQNYETDFMELTNELRAVANTTYEDNTGSVKYCTISKWCQNWLKDKFGKESKYVPNGIDLKQFPYTQRSFNGKIKILIEGNSDDYYKNVDESFKIVAKLDKNKYEIQYLSYKGTPKDWYYVDKFLHKVPYEEVGKIYNGADILLKTSILESFSYPPLEMMATGGLVVVAPNGGNVEYLKNEENCLFYEPGNIEDAVKQIERLGNKELRDKLIKNGLETAKKRQWSIIEEDIVKMYEGK
jgi:glycosyltransferase involved in cell wall biosynthesis